MKPGKSGDEPWAPTGTMTDLPWHPDWTVHARCRGQYGKPESPDDDRYDPFFDFNANDPDTLAAKSVCYGCPVRMRCLVENLYVPFGIFGGYTDKERRQLRRDKRVRSEQVGYFRHGIQEAG